MKKEKAMRTDYSVAIPSNQVGNFHRSLPRASEEGKGRCVAIPSNQVGNFHPSFPPPPLPFLTCRSQSLQIRSVISIENINFVALLESREVAIPSNQVGNFHPSLLADKEAFSAA